MILSGITVRPTPGNTGNFGERTARKINARLHESGAMRLRRPGQLLCCSGFQMSSGPSVYSLLGTRPNDVLAALAYTMYTQHRVETIRKSEARTGASPSAEDLDTFERCVRTHSALAMYKEHAVATMKAFVDETLASEQAALQADFISTSIGRQLSSIQANQVASKSLSGRFREVSANLAVNLMTILVIGSLVFGYRWIEVWSERLGEHAGVGPAGPDNRTCEPALTC